MTHSAVVSGRIAAETAVKLDKLAERLDRSRAWIVARAVEQFVEEEAEFLASLDEAERQIDRGEFFTQEQMEAWFEARRRGEAAE